MKKLENETQENYRKRRNETQKSIKNHLKGRWFWKSKVVFVDPLQQLKYLKYGDKNLQSNGTYVKK